MDDRIERFQREWDAKFDDFAKRIAQARMFSLVIVLLQAVAIFIALLLIIL